MSSVENLKARASILEALQREILGPDPNGEPTVSTSAEEIRFDSEQWYRPKKQLNGEEILWQDPPSKRYGAGVLFPSGTSVEREAALDTEQEIGRDADTSEDDGTEGMPERGSNRPDESADYEIGLANTFKQASLGLSFLCDFDAEREGVTVEFVDIRRTGRPGSSFVEITPGRYQRSMVTISPPGASSSDKAYKRPFWRRIPVLDSAGARLRVRFSRDELLDASGPIRRPLLAGPAHLRVTVVSRRWPRDTNGHMRLVTVSVTNVTPLPGITLDEACVFQCGVRVSGESGAPWIAPYGERIDAGTDVQDSENELRYSKVKTFAVGHGCAAEWKDGQSNLAKGVWTATLPALELPTISADAFVASESGVREALRVSMRRLAGLEPGNNGLDDIGRLLDEYEKWIERRETRVQTLIDSGDRSAQVARRIVERCRNCLSRARRGLLILRGHDDRTAAIRRAFSLANHAMLIVQLKSGLEAREAKMSGNSVVSWSRSALSVDDVMLETSKGYWRPFQIVFLLMSIEGISDPEHADRKVVDLIWFPTGGGKTEAYLGLSAFTILLGRLTNQRRSGVDVLMRYTLRLLTAQQFQRAALLFCALEWLRSKSGEPPTLGKERFTVGLFVGGDTTPNKRSGAIAKLNALRKNPEADNPFVLRQCPWCAASFGHVGGGSSRFVHGYARGRSEAGGDTVIFVCPDTSCFFGSDPATARRASLPVLIVDEDILDKPPNLLVGTVDKFAMLGWKPELRRIFGIGSDGWHTGAPPALIIQDELHLISGPLGSMVGAFELAIEELCRDHDHRRTVDPTSWPKIVASTATISRAEEQILGLYGRERVAIFPPPGLDADDSFFATYARDENGNLASGRLYVGVLASAHGSAQTTLARVYATLVQAPMAMEADEKVRDPWWTLLSFFNSLRELGAAATLLVSDARDYQNVILDRVGAPYTNKRSLTEVEELTSRIRSDMVPALLQRLESPYKTSAESAKPIDVCLASNIIEVGVDIQRLGVMCISGQPKTTSQYIQVSSRVGRRSDCPGLVVVLYSPTKPRDRSHYERFRPYHEKIYAQVEPTSVTPFSAPAAERAIHSVMLSIVRQLGDQGSEARTPDPCPLVEGNSLRDTVLHALRSRLQLVAPEEAGQVMDLVERRIRQWRVWNPDEYGDFGPTPTNPPLIHPAGRTPPESWRQRSWPAMTSMRNVDATCEAHVTPFFNLTEEP